MGDEGPEQVQRIGIRPYLTREIEDLLTYL